nr:hypothetical protein [Tanacetum cinerariifolium]
MLRCMMDKSLLNRFRDELQVILGIRGYQGNQNNGQGVNNKKKVICYNSRGEGHVARQLLDVEAKVLLADVECTVPLAEPLALTTINISSQINGVRTFNDNIFETVSPSWPSEVPQDEHLDSDDDSRHKDYSIPYDQYLATKESQDVPTEASPIPSTAAYINAKLEQETELLKTTLRNKEATIADLTSETKTFLSEKKTLEDKYLKEIVCLKNANQVATGLLPKF